MKCVYCNCTESRVIDSRQTDDGYTIRRRRECEGCGRRFTTYEKIDAGPLMVVKKDKSRETFDSNKIKTGILKACKKRPVSIQSIDALVRGGRGPGVPPVRPGGDQPGHRGNGDGRAQKIG